MQITRQLSWPVATWPANAPATQYALFQIYPTNVGTPLQTVSTTTAQLTYDESVSAVYQIRPTDGTLYGPECGSFVVGEVYCRAWLRQKIRYALADQQQQVSSNVVINWSDEEINTYIHEALAEISILFPNESNLTLSMGGPTLDPEGNPTGTRVYPLPTNCYSVHSVEYVTQSGKLHMWLKEKPFRGGESSAQSYIGYPKLGILLSPLSGRYFPGHYEVYDGQLYLDWDPEGTGDYINIRYSARYAIPTSDVQLITDMPPEDLELVSLRAQMKCWLRVEGQDVRLSRWTDGKKRDDLPTVKMSVMIKNLYNELVNDRRELRPRVRRLVRR